MTTTTKTVGFGLMGLSWKAEPVPDEQAFGAMRAAVENNALHWSTSTFYGPPSDPLANIKLIQRYFQKYPEDAQKVQLYVKGCFDGTTYKPDSSEQAVRASLKGVTDLLNPNEVNLYFGPARKDPNVPIKEWMTSFKRLVEEKQIKGIFLSEVGPATIKEALTVHPLSALEVEFSLWSPDLLENGVGELTRENNIPILAYSPLGRGFLTGAIRSKSDIPEGDIRLHMDRFQGENFDKNIELADRISSFSRSLHVTPAQVALAWIFSRQSQAGTIIPIPGASKAGRVEENSHLIDLAADKIEELDRIMPHHQVAGGRARAAAAHMLWA